MATEARYEIDRYRIPMATVERGFYRNVLKRFLDIIISLPAVIVMLPILVLVKIIYVLSGDFHSIFYAQTRIGQNGKPFKMYKIRTMVPNADEVLKELLRDKKIRAEWDKTQKLHNDPRITKVGKILRHGSIDEIPQFINVLAGQLSLIGPRPLVPGELEKHGGSKELYWSVKPGMTGWWAVSERSNTSDYKKRLALEYYYVENQSLKLDIVIFLKTFGTIVGGDGAK